MLRHWVVVVATASIWLGAACSPADDTTNVFCVFAGTPSRGRCPSLCSWQCGVADANECDKTACRELCILSHQDWEPACATAAYDQWLCMATRGRGPTTCGDETVTFSPQEGTCDVETRTARAQCGLDDPLMLSPAPELCEWQCALARATDCDVSDCEAACRARVEASSEACIEGVTDLWTCMAESGRTATECGEDAIVFGRAESTCEAVLTAAREVCDDDDPTRIDLSVARSDAGADAG